MSRTVGLVVPAFRPNVDVLRAYVRDLAAHVDPATIRIELDDPTAETLDRLGDLPATINAVDRRRGKGAAITAGFCALETDVRAFVDADGSTAVESVAAVVDRVRVGDADLAVGTRRHPDSNVVTAQPALRHRLGGAFAWFARHLLSVPVSDYQCGAKAIDRIAWSDVCSLLRESGFAWDVELVALVDALGYRIAEVPVTWAAGAESTVSSMGTTVELAGGLVRAHHGAKRLRGDRLHAAIAARRPEPVRVVDRLEFESHREREHDDD